MKIWSNNINTSSAITLAQTELNLLLLYHKSSLLPLSIPNWLMIIFFPYKSTMYLEGAEGNLGFGFGFACFPAYIKKQIILR